MNSIIVYRNPIEAMLWEGLMSGNLFPIYAGLFVFLASIIITHTFAQKKFGNLGKRSARAQTACLIFSGVFALFTTWYLI